jgi:hypothetical protein
MKLAHSSLLETHFRRSKTTDNSPTQRRRKQHLPQFLLTYW